MAPPALPGGASRVSRVLGCRGSETADVLDNCLGFANVVLLDLPMWFRQNFSFWCQALFEDEVPQIERQEEILGPRDILFFY